MTINTEPLVKVIEAWRELNVERVEALAALTPPEGGDLRGTPDLWKQLERVNDLELFRLRDIAGEAMQLVDEIEAHNRTAKAAEADGVWVVQVEWRGDEPGDYAGWVSVHTTEAGARAMLERRADEYDLDLSAIDDGEDRSGSTYSLSKLPVQE